MLSCTPDGVINFISEGYGGRTSDLAIVEDCDFLTKLKSGMHIMADRGFKHLEPLLCQKGCKLVRPPSVLADEQSTSQEVRTAKRIAALRIHVERVIGRIRDFKILLPHACVDNHHIQRMDSIVIIACALINIQSPIMKY